MNKHQFLDLLNKKLKNLPKEEKEDALRYYEEYFEEAQINEHEDVLSELSHPSEIASQLLSEQAIKGINENNASMKKSISSIWFILLAILASPIAFPIALTIIILIFVAIILVLVFLFVFVVVSGSLIGSGFIVLISGFRGLFTSFATSITTIGVGLLLIGITALVVVGTYILVTKIFKVIIKFSSQILSKYKSEKKEKY